MSWRKDTKRRRKRSKNVERAKLAKFASMTMVMVQGVAVVPEDGPKAAVGDGTVAPVVTAMAVGGDVNITTTTDMWKGIGPDNHGSS